MPWGNRSFAGVPGPTAEGDKWFWDYVYDDTSGALSLGMPLYVEVTDAAEFNTDPTTGLSTVGIKNTGGNVVLGTNAAAGANLVCVGLFQPTNRNSLPNKGDSVRVLAWGRGIVSAQSPGGGAAGLVGSNLIASAAVKQAVPGARASGVNIGILLATGAVVTTGSQLFAAASAAANLYNCFVALG
jgi:hypothetical protein